MGKNGAGGGGGGSKSGKRQSKTIGDKSNRKSQYAKKQIARKRAKQVKKFTKQQKKERDAKTRERNMARDYEAGNNMDSWGINPGRIY